SLSVTALVLFLQGLERRSVMLALASGLVAGLAAQTKYTGLLLPPLFLAAAWIAPIGQKQQRPTLRVRVLFGMLACVVAALIFVSWEALIRRKYGESHFGFATGEHTFSWQEKRHLFLPMLILLGGLLPPAAMLGLAGLTKNRRWLLPPVVILTAAYLALTLVPIRESIWIDLPDKKPVASGIFGLLGGLSILVLIAVVARQLFRLSRFHSFDLAQWMKRLRFSRDLWFLLLWLLIETAGYLAMTPFPACRRLIGFTLVAMLLAGRLVSRTCRSSDGRKIVWLAVIAGLPLGLFYAGIDLAD